MSLRLINNSEPIGKRIYHILREQIIKVELKPGTILSESEMSRKFSMSRQPIRESFIKLCEEGLVIIMPQRGTMVSPISAKAVMDARFAREAIEADIVKILAEKRNAALIKELKKQVIRQESLSQAEYGNFMVLDETFHRTLAEGAKKENAWKLIEGIKSHMDRVRYLDLQVSDVGLLVGQHRKIVEGIESGNSNEAELNMRKHLQKILQDLPQLEKKFKGFFSN